MTAKSFWKSNSILFKWKTTLNIFENGRRPRIFLKIHGNLWKWKMTPLVKLNGKRPQINGRWSWLTNLTGCELGTAQPQLVLVLPFFLFSPRRGYLRVSTLCMGSYVPQYIRIFMEKTNPGPFQPPFFFGSFWGEVYVQPWAKKTASNCNFWKKKKGQDN